MSDLCRIYVELCRMNVGFMSNEAHVKKAQPIDIHIVSGRLMSNVEQNREKENKETSRSPHLIKKGLYRLFEKQGCFMPSRSRTSRCRTRWPCR